MAWTAYGGNILIEVENKPISSSIILLEGDNETEDGVTHAIVRSVGGDATDENTGLEVGQRVIVHDFAGYNITINGKHHKIVRSSDILMSWEAGSFE